MNAVNGSEPDCFMRTAVPRQNSCEIDPNANATSANATSAIGRFSVFAKIGVVCFTCGNTRISTTITTAVSATGNMNCL